MFRTCFGTVDGRRMLLSALDDATKEKNRAFMSRRGAMERMGTDRMRSPQDDDLVKPHDDRAANALRNHQLLERVICEQRGIAPEPVHTREALIGSVVMLQPDKAGAVAYPVRLAGHGEEFPEHSPPFVAYTGPVGRQLLRKVVGDSITLPSGTAEIVDIMLMPDYLSMQDQIKASA